MASVRGQLWRDSESAALVVFVLVPVSLVARDESELHNAKRGSRAAGAAAVSVYVDDMHTSPIGQFGRMKMSHMIADTTEELLDMADRIGVARKWIQKAGTRHEHFDIALSKRRLAVKEGAIELTMRELAEIKRKTKQEQS